MLITDLYDYSNAYIFVKGIITVTSTNNADRRNKKLILKNNSPFRSCISKSTAVVDHRHLKVEVAD